jgi:hypothetical protein
MGADDVAVVVRLESESGAVGVFSTAATSRGAAGTRGAFVLLLADFELFEGVGGVEGRAVMLAAGAGVTDVLALSAVPVALVVAGCGAIAAVGVLP